MSIIVKDIVKSLISVERSTNAYEVFKDFIYLASYSVQNVAHYCQGREDKYLEIAKKYSREQMNSFAEILGKLTLALDSGFDDYLGCVYMDKELHNPHMGQFFTPFTLSDMISSMLCSEDDLMNRDYLLINEPACGSGSMIIANFKAWVSKGINPQKSVFYIAQDLDPLVARMCYLQISLMGASAIVKIGDSLDITAQNECLYTPMYYFMGWGPKLQA